MELEIFIWNPHTGLGRQWREAIKHPYADYVLNSITQLHSSVLVFDHWSRFSSTTPPHCSSGSLDTQKFRELKYSTHSYACNSFKKTINVSILSSSSFFCWKFCKIRMLCPFLAPTVVRYISRPGRPSRNNYSTVDKDMWDVQVKSLRKWFQPQIFL